MPENRPKLKLLDLFSGIRLGGFSLGLERTGGFETVQFVENDPSCQQALAHHWPEVPIHEDVRTFEPVRSVDVVTAGFPCQDISNAGTGAGITGERSRLFWEVVRTICLVGPALTILENVAALLHRGMGDVLGALATTGRDAEWDCVSACQYGLPQNRTRVFIVSHNSGDRKLQPGWSFCNERGWVSDCFQAPAWPLGVEVRDAGGSGFSDRLVGNAVIPSTAEGIGRAWLEANPCQ